MKKARRKSPIREKPLRNPGQSVRDEIERLLTEEVAVWVLVPIFATFFPVLEWLRWIGRLPPDPLWNSVLAVVVVAYSLWRLRSARIKLR